VCQGVAFVDTSNLDGETNLKARYIYYEREGAAESSAEGGGGADVAPFSISRFLKTVRRIYLFFFIPRPPF